MSSTFLSTALGAAAVSTPKPIIRGLLQIVGGYGTTANATISAVVMNKTRVRMLGSRTSSTDIRAAHGYIYLSSATTLTVEKSYDDGGLLVISYEVEEWS
ncbi:MAG: hypothetical protein ABIQ60_15605 [Burkholderiaceae bacterium]